MAQLLVINGPNLNMLGAREPAIYGHQTLSDIEKSLRSLINGRHSLEFMQSNAENVLIDRIHKAFYEKADFIVINPGALTHTSIALRDAFLSTMIPFIEIHLSNVFARESFRHHSYLSDIAKGVICGFGALGYELAITAAIHHIEASGSNHGYQKNKKVD